MFLVGISQVKNECDIIETSIRENLRVLDILFVVDDSSEDDTLTVLQSLARENLPIIILSLQDERLSIFFDHGKSMTYLMRFAINYCYTNRITSNVDFVFPLDADEIIGSSREVLEAACMAIPKNHYGLLRWKNYVPCYGEYSSNKNLIDVFRSPEQETNFTYKSIIPGYIAFTSIIRTGSHSILSRNEKFSPFFIENIPLLHFPVRSSNQIIGKSLIAAHKTFLRTHPNSRENYHLKELAEDIRTSNYQLNHDALFKLTNKYISTSQHIPKTPDKYLASLSHEPSRYPVEASLQLLKALDSLFLKFTRSPYSRFSRIAFWINSKLNRLHVVLIPSTSAIIFKQLSANHNA